MIRMLILVVILLAGMILGPMVVGQKGYVLVVMDDYSIETSVLAMVMILLIFYAALQVVEWFLVNLFTLWGRTRHWFGWRRRRVARKKSLSGVLALAEGDFIEAEKLSVRNAPLSEMPLLNYLTAAEAAQQRGRVSQRDNYLQLAEDKYGTQLAVHATRLRLLLDNGEYEEALAYLNNQSAAMRNESALLRHSYLIYQQLGEWQLLLDNLVLLAKRKLLPAEESERLTRQAHQGLMSEQLQLKGTEGLQRYWQKLPRALKADNLLFVEYVRLMQSKDGFETVAPEVIKRIKKQGDEALLGLLPQGRDEDAEALLSQLSPLVKQGSDNGALYACLGQLASQARQWSQAKEMLQQAVNLTPTVELYHLLAAAQQQLGEPTGALDSYSRGAKLMAQ